MKTEKAGFWIAHASAGSSALRRSQELPAVGGIDELGEACQHKATDRCDFDFSGGWGRVESKDISI